MTTTAPRGASPAGALKGLPRRRRPRFLALLLVGAILLCHGLLWSLHHCSGAPISAEKVVFAEEAHGHHSPAGANEHEGSGCHLLAGVADYFVVTLALFFGLLLRAARPWGTASSPPTAPYLRLRFSAGPPPRGPTMQTLQVFRL